MAVFGIVPEKELAQADWAEQLESKLLCFLGGDLANVVVVDRH